MDNKKNDGYYIDKIKNDLVFINNHVSGKSYEEFLDDEVLQDSMMFRLVQISENSKNLSDTFKKMHAGIPWTDVYGLQYADNVCGAVRLKYTGENEKYWDMVSEMIFCV